VIAICGSCGQKNRVTELTKTNRCGKCKTTIDVPAQAATNADIVLGILELLSEEGDEDDWPEGLDGVADILRDHGIDVDAYLEAV
jgi:hypothetical protein